MSHSIFPGLVVFLPLGCAVMLSAVTGAWPHSHILSILALCSLSNWGLSPSPQESLQTLPLGQSRTTGFHLLGWAQIYHSIPSPPSMASSFYFYSLLSVLAEVALSYWLPSLIFLNKTKNQKKDGQYFKWSAPEFDPHMNWKDNPVTHFKHTITDSW